MVIQNNFNSKNALSNNNYTHIGKGDSDVNKRTSSNRFLEENRNNNVVKDVLIKDHEYNADESKDKDKWDFFK